MCSLSLPCSTELSLHRGQGLGENENCSGRLPSPLEAHFAPQSWQCFRAMGTSEMQAHSVLLCFQTILKEGMLTKQNNSFQRSKRRYFKLRGRTLYYAKTAKVRHCERIKLRSHHLGTEHWCIGWILANQLFLAVFFLFYLFIVCSGHAGIEPRALDVLGKFYYWTTVLFLSGL